MNDKDNNVTPLRPPPEAGSFLDQAAALAGYEGRTAEWAAEVVQAEAKRLVAKQPQPGIERDWQDWKALAARLKHTRAYLVTQILPNLAAQARAPISQEQLIADAELMVEQIESGETMKRAHAQSNKVRTFTEADAKAELRKRGK